MRTTPQAEERGGSSSGSSKLPIDITTDTIGDGAQSAPYDEGAQLASAYL